MSQIPWQMDVNGACTQCFAGSTSHSTQKRPTALVTAGDNPLKYFIFLLYSDAEPNPKSFCCTPISAKYFRISLLNTSGTVVFSGDFEVSACISTKPTGSGVAPGTAKALRTEATWAVAHPVVEKRMPKPPRYGENLWKMKEKSRF